MGIDTSVERLIPLRDAALEMTRLRYGPASPARRTNLTTHYRWTNSGCRGVVLESVQIGATRCTSQEAMQRFFVRMTDGVASKLDHSEHSPPIGPTPASERAGKILELAGA